MPPQAHADHFRNIMVRFAAELAECQIDVRKGGHDAKQAAAEANKVDGLTRWLCKGSGIFSVLLTVRLLRQVHDSCGFTQAETAEVFGISKFTVNDYFKEKMIFSKAVQLWRKFEVLEKYPFLTELITETRNAITQSGSRFTPGYVSKIFRHLLQEPIGPFRKARFIQSKEPDFYRAYRFLLDNPPGLDIYSEKAMARSGYRTIVYCLLMIASFFPHEWELMKRAYNKHQHNEFFRGRKFDDEVLEYFVGLLRDYPSIANSGWADCMLLATDYSDLWDGLVASFRVTQDLELARQSSEELSLLIAAHNQCSNMAREVSRHDRLAQLEFAFKESAGVVLDLFEQKAFRFRGGRGMPSRG